MRKDIDDVLKQALTPTEEPDFWLNQKILNQESERTTMKRKNTKKIPAVVFSALLVLGVGSVSVFAAWKYLAPDKVAEKFEDSRLADAFTEENAVLVNETQSYGGYDVTLLGVISGKELSDYTDEAKLSEGKTYSVVAIKNTDGSPMAEIKDDAYSDTDFFVSPFINGYDPSLYNVTTMTGGYQDVVEDGVLYRISICDNVEIFADEKIYLGVLDETFYQADAYTFNEATGEISRNEAYEGLNALFELPLDESKADAAAVEAYLEKMEQTASEETEIEATEVDEWMSKITAENINEYAVPVESTVKVLTPDSDGMIAYDYEMEGGDRGYGKVLVEDIFPDGKTGMCGQFSCSSSGTLDTLDIETFTLNEDGTVTFAIYVPR